MNESKMKTWFAILPYVVVGDRLSIMGIPFCTSNNVEGLSPREQEHLRELKALFDKSDQNSDAEVTYTLLRNMEGSDKQRMDQLRAAHVVLTFLMMQDAYDHPEHFSLFVAQPAVVSSMDKPYLTDGYEVLVNWKHFLEIPAGGELRLPHYDPRTAYTIDISEIAFSLERASHLEGLREFVAGHLLCEPEQKARYDTILRAMQWYNKSYSILDTQEEKLISLAVAFEVLFHGKDSPFQTIAKELQSHLSGLYGETYLDEWVDQFYNERSRIVHEGFSDQSRYHSNGDSEYPTDSLVSYGQKILRMSIFSILESTHLAEEYNLNAWFVHDEKKLRQICKRLSDESKTPDDRLLSVVKLVFDLESHYRHVYTGQWEVDLKTIHAAGKLLIETFLDTKPEVNPEVQTSLQKVVEMDTPDPQAFKMIYGELHRHIAHGLATYKRKYWPMEPYQAIAHFAKYASELSVRIPFG